MRTRNGVSILSYCLVLTEVSGLFQTREGPQRRLSSGGEGPKEVLSRVMRSMSSVPLGNQFLY